MSGENQLVPIEQRTDMADAPVMNAVPVSQEPNPLKKLHAILRGRYRWAVGLGLALAIVGGLLGFLLPSPLYKSTGVIRIVPITPEVLSDTGDKNILPMFEGFVNSQVALIRSRRVIDGLTRSDAYKRLGRGTDTEALITILENLEVVRPQRSELIFVSYEDPDKYAAQQIATGLVQAYLSIVNTDDRDERLGILEALRERLRADERRLSQLRVERSAKWGTDDLNALFNVRLQESSRLESQLREIEIALRAAERLSPSANPEDPAGANKNAEPGAAPAAGGAAAPAAAAAAAEPAGPPILQAEDLTVSLIAARDQKMAGLVNTRESLQRQINVTISRLGPEHREVRQQQAALAQMDRSIEEYAAEYRGNYIPGVNDNTLGASIDQLRARHASVKLQFETLQKQTLEVGQERLEIDRIKTEEKIVRDRLREVANRIEDLNVERSVDNRIVLLSEGDEPLKPSRDRRKVAAAAGFMFGGGLGFGIVFLIGLLDRRLRSIDDAQDSFAGIPLIGSLPVLPHDLADPAQAAIASHSVHQIRTMLQIGSGSQGRRCFAITSPGSGDGKTSLALALGVSFAATGARTLLIDADMLGGDEGLTDRANAIIRRKIGRVLQREQLVTEHQIEQALRVAAERGRKLGETLIDLGYLTQAQLDTALTLQEQMPVGLLDALEGDDLEHCVAETGIDNLFVLPIGAADPEDVCKIAPSYISRLLVEARRKFDIVLVDTGPVPVSLEASHMAADADAVVLVLSRGEQRGPAEKAIEHLVSIGARLSGLVFNRAEALQIDQANDDVPPGAVARRSGTQSASKFGPVAQAVASSSRSARNGR
jgi:uncharacterized protein involved in exopolysaccharide biosynthesis/Mrp family chromosome partitioning ATPase